MTQKALVLIAPSFDTWIKDPFRFGAMDILADTPLYHEGIEVSVEILFPGKESDSLSRRLYLAHILTELHVGNFEYVVVAGDGTTPIIQAVLRAIKTPNTKLVNKADLNSPLYDTLQGFIRLRDGDIRV